MGDSDDLRADGEENAGAWQWVNVERGPKGVFGNSNKSTYSSRLD
jgi:hypothetical protein